MASRRRRYDWHGGLESAALVAAGTLVALVLAACVGTVPLATSSDGNVAEDIAYRISAEDVLEISVWKEEDLQRTVIVRPDGGISFPLAGDLRASGRTPMELQAEITTRLEAYIPDAVVTVSVQELKGLRVYVSGKVLRPGQYEVGRYIDVLQAITLAGGLTPYASPSNIKILRREGGRELVLSFNYNEVKNGRNLQQNILLRSDDVVVVP